MPEPTILAAKAGEENMLTSQTRMKTQARHGLGNTPEMAME
jgi:hypothetical protein